MPGPPPPDRAESAGSPAAAVTSVAGLLALLVSLNDAAYIMSLFFSAVSLAALPLAVADRPGGRLLRFAFLGAGSAVVAAALVVVPLLTSDQAKAGRTEPPPARVSLPAAPSVSLALSLPVSLPVSLGVPLGVPLTSGPAALTALGGPG